MSPEQWNGEPLDARSDLYAVGVMLYEMLTGRLPFEAQTPMELVRKHLTEKPAPPSAVRPARPVSPDLEALVMQSISGVRDERPATADAMRGELLACALAPEPDARAAARESPRTLVLPQRPLPRRSGRLQRLGVGYPLAVAGPRDDESRKWTSPADGSRKRLAVMAGSGLPVAFGSS
jgi:serine/threonine protein kinase